MARINNAINYGLGFNIGAKAPIDSRMLVEFISDLTDASNWQDDSAPVYEGMLVTVKEDNCIYILKDASNYTDLASWKKVGDSLDGSKVEISSAYTQVDYPDVSGSTYSYESVESNDSLDLAMNKVETNISTLVQETLDNELVVAQALTKLNESAGFTTSGDYDAHVNDALLSGAVSLHDADLILSQEIAALKSKDTNVDTTVDDLTERVTALEEGIDCGTY